MANIGKYQLVEKVAETNTNIIYKVKYNSESLILKQLLNSLSLQDVNRIKKEALLLSKISNEKVISLKSYFQGDEYINPYIILEYFKGITLQNYLLLKNFLISKQSIDIIKQILFGLNSIHEQSIVHQDIGPKNIIINDDGLIKIIDFSAAKKIGEPALNELLQAHGTANYISPETILGKNLTIKSDIYSLGLVFLELLTGKKVFSGTNDADISISRVTNPKIQIPERINGKLKDIIESMLQFEPNNRPNAIDIYNKL